MLKKNKTYKNVKMTKAHRNDSNLNMQKNIS